MAPRKNKKYIFIDTSFYYNLFSESKNFPKEFLEIIEKLVTVTNIVFLLPQQVKDEIERNCVDQWFFKKELSLKNKLTNLDKKINILDLEYNDYSENVVSKIRKEIQKEQKSISKKIEEYKKQFLSPRSSSRMILNKLINLAEPINDSEEILYNAYIRKEKGNPPKHKESLGDQIIWESILSYLSKKKSNKPTLIYLAQDKDAWKSKADKKLKFNPWLQKEYKKKTNGKVVLIEKISQIKELTPAEQKKIKDEEEKEAKRNIILNLKTSVPEKIKVVNTFKEAEKLMKNIESNLDAIDVEGIEQLLIASIENRKYSAGPFNQVIDASYAPIFFKKLLKKAINFNFNLNAWKSFYIKLDENSQKRFYDLRKLLQGEGIIFTLTELKYIHVDDIPF